MANSKKAKRGRPPKAGTVANLPEPVRRRADYLITYSGLSAAAIFDQLGLFDFEIAGRTWRKYVQELKAKSGVKPARRGRQDSEQLRANVGAAAFLTFLEASFGDYYVECFVRRLAYLRGGHERATPMMPPTGMEGRE